MDERFLTFVCVISRDFEANSEREVINLLSKEAGSVSLVLSEDKWDAPVQYIKEMGHELKTKLYVFDTHKSLFEIENLKDLCIRIEKETSDSGLRKFNLNPGFLSDKGMFLISHKPSDVRGRKKLLKYWTEKQWEYEKGVGYVPNENTFSEYNGVYLDYFNSK